MADRTGATRAVRARLRTPVRRFGYHASVRSWLPAALLLLTGLLWLLGPLLWSRLAPNGGQINREAPLVLLVEVLLLGLLGVGLWIDSGREPGTIGAVVIVVAANCLLRAFFNVGGGLEFNYALPLLVGAAGGAPLGIFAGALSCLLSQFGLDLVATPLPAQIVIWALFGLTGGLLRRLRPVVAWLASIPVALLMGPVTGMLLNATGWVPVVGTDTTSFYPGLPPATLFRRLWEFSQQTSLALDLTRGVTTAILVLLLGLPVLRLLRPLWAPALAPTLNLLHRNDPDPAAISRRQDLERLDSLWGKETDR